MKTLIVDDNYASRKLLKAYLESYGPCTTANDGREGLEAFLQNFDQGAPFDLVCLDIMMPEMDGREVLRHLREGERTRGVPQAEQVKVVMTTALDDRKDIIESFNEGCEGYIIKPIEGAQLTKVLVQLGLISADEA